MKTESVDLLPKLSDNNINQLSLPTSQTSLLSDSVYFTYTNERQESFSLASRLLFEGYELEKKGEYKNCLQKLYQSLELCDNSPKTHFLMGKCYFKLEEYDLAYKHFIEAIQLKIPHKVSISYFYCAVCSLKMKNYQESLEQINYSLSTKKNIKSEELLIRGKSLMGLERYDEAIDDFLSLKQNQPYSVTAYVLLSKIYIIKGRINDAIQEYSAALCLKNCIVPKTLFHRAYCYYLTNNFKKALHDVNGAIARSPELSRAYHLLGLVMIKTKQTQKAINAFEHCIKLNNHQKTLIKSFEELIKIYLKEKDIYSANFVLARSQKFDLNSNDLNVLNLYCTGILFLMKGRYFEGITQLSKAEKFKDTNSFLIPQIYSYRGYGYFCLGHYDYAVKDYMKLQQYGMLSKGDLYNRTICVGVQDAFKKNFVSASYNFDAASKICPTTKEPYFYKALCSVMSYVLNEKNELTYSDSLVKVLQDAVGMVDEAWKEFPNNSIYLFYAGLFRMFLGQYSQADHLFEQSIDNSDDDSPQAYYYKGLNLAAAKNFEAAKNDLRFAEFDGSADNTLLLQAACEATLGNKSNALEYISHHLSINKNDRTAYATFGDFYFYFGDISNALKVYESIESIEEMESTLLERAKCYFSVRELSNTLEDYIKLCRINKKKKEYVFDKECLLALKNLTKPSSHMYNNRDEAIYTLKQLKNNFEGEGIIFKKPDMVFYLGLCYFLNEKYHEAKEEWRLLVNFEIIETRVKEGRTYKLYTGDTISLPHILYNMIVVDLFLNDRGGAIAKLKILSNLLEELSIIDDCIRVREIIENLKVEVTYKAEKENIDIRIFQNDSKLLSSTFPLVTIPVNNQINLQTQMYFDVPRIVPPDLEPQINVNLLANVTIKPTKCHQEAPWVQKNGNTICFTSKLTDYDEIEVGSVQEYLEIFDNTSFSMTDKLRKIIVKAFDEAEVNAPSPVSTKKKSEININELKLSSGLENKINKIIMRRVSGTLSQQQKNSMSCTQTIIIIQFELCF